MPGSDESQLSVQKIEEVTELPLSPARQPVFFHGGVARGRGLTSIGLARETNYPCDGIPPVYLAPLGQ